MTPTTNAPVTSPVRRVPRFVWVGVALLIVTFIGASKSLPTSDRSAPEKPSKEGIRPGGFGRWDLDHGITHLYPLQPGHVAEVFKYDGDEAKEGDPLFRMDDQLVKQDWERAKQAVKAAEIQERRAKTAVTLFQVKIDSEIAAQKQIIAAKSANADAAREKSAEVDRLFKGQNASEESAKAAANQVKALDAEVQAEQEKLKGLEASREPQLKDMNDQVAAATVDLADKQAQEGKAKIVVDKCIVRAPKKGQVLRSFVRVGEMLGTNPQTPAMEYASEGRLIVRAEIDQEFAEHVYTGQTAMVQDDTRGGPVWTGRVIRVSNWQAKKRSQVFEPLNLNDIRTIEVIIELDSPPPLKIGQQLRVMLE